MKNQRVFASAIFYFCFTLTLLIPVTGSADQEKMTAAEMRALIPSNTLSGGSVHVYHDPSGAMEGMRRGQGMHFDSGTWTITDAGQYCRQWSRWGNKALDCFHIYRLDNNKLLLQSADDPYYSIVKFREGNPECIRVHPSVSSSS